MRTWTNLRSIVTLLAVAVLLMPAIGYDVLPSGGASAALATSDCDELQVYMDEVDAITNGVEADNFGGQGIFGGGPDVTVFNASPEQFITAAQAIDQIAKDLAEIHPPEIAREYHRKMILGIQMFANMLRDASTMGFMSAGMMYAFGPDSAESSEAIDALEDEIDKQCPGFAAWSDQSDDLIATPTSGT